MGTKPSPLMSVAQRPADNTPRPLLPPGQLSSAPKPLMPATQSGFVPRQALKSAGPTVRPLMGVSSGHSEGLPPQMIQGEPPIPPGHMGPPGHTGSPRMPPPGHMGFHPPGMGPPPGQVRYALHTV